jgi:high-affinity K+ transport system ATPase subunit B
MPPQAAVIFSILIILALIVPALAGVRFLPSTW